MGFIDAVLLLGIAALAWIGWLVGMFKKRAQWWVLFFGPIGIAYMGWYYFWVLLPRVQPALLGEGMQTGQWTIVFMVGGVWALIAKPRPPKPRKTTSVKT